MGLGARAKSYHMCVIVTHCALLPIPYWRRYYLTTLAKTIPVTSATLKWHQVVAPGCTHGWHLAEFMSVPSLSAVRTTRRASSRQQLLYICIEFLL